MATLAERLVEAENAYHDLQIGKSARVYVDSNGERVEYTVANRAELQKYIQSLNSLIAAEAGTPLPSGPMRPFLL